MSRLIDKFKKLSQAAPQPMGFRTSRPAEATTTILIIARWEINNTDSPAKSIEGADALLLGADKADLTVKGIQKIVKPLGDVPWGVYLDESGDKQAALIEAGCDFVVLSPASGIPATPQDEKVGKILQVESSMDDGLLRAVNDLPADAVLLADTFEDNASLVWHQLMIFRHLAAFISKPLIVPVPATISEAELKALWNAGIDGVMVEIDITKAGDLKELRQTMSKLPPRSTQKRGKMDVMLPRMGGGETGTMPPDEEEEEDE
jgi:hypothetical protein